ncbi:MAG: vWA domain-containing protein [Actinomycetota bacterium]
MGVGLRAGRRRQRGRCGKSWRPDWGHDLSLKQPPSAREGDDADEAVADARKRTTSRRELARRPDFEQISPEVGELDEQAVEEALSGDPDETLTTLAELTGATDPVLRDLARRLAGRLFLDLARRGPARPRGAGRLQTERFRPEAGDLDLDASLQAIVDARAGGVAVDPDQLFVRTWSTPDTAFCLLVDRSGSMGGRPLATSALAAAAVACRAPHDHSVLSFGKDVVAAKSQDVGRSIEAVVDAVLALRGFGTTDVAGALLAAEEQLGRTNAARKVTILLSDCRATESAGSGEPAEIARRLDELVIVAPDGDSEEAEALAAAVGARIATVDGPSDVVRALTDVLDR